jgi:RNA exonuclease 4
MAVYRIHRKTWEKGFPHSTTSNIPVSRKRSIAQTNEEMDGDSDDDAVNTGAVASKTSVTTRFPGGGRKGVSSGLSVVVKRKEKKTQSEWWKGLGDASK